MAETVKDIVKKAKVSHSTVSRTLHNHLEITCETVERTQWLVRENNCLINRFTQSSKTNSSIHRLGIMAHRVIDVFYNEIEGGLENVVRSLIIGDSFFTSVHIPMILVRNRAAEVLP